VAGPQPPLRDVIDQLGAGAKVTISSAETSEDRVHRHRMEWLMARLGVGVIAAVLLFSMGIVLWAPDAEVRKGGIAILVAIVSGLLGYLAGRSSK
jgi:hypothetical protein